MPRTTPRAGLLYTLIPYIHQMVNQSPGSTQPLDSWGLDHILYRSREDAILEFAHQLVGLLCQAERQDSMR